MSWTVNHDTVTVVIENQSGTPMGNLFYTDYTSVPLTLIDCIIDGTATSPTQTETSSGSVYSTELTTRYLLGPVTNSVTLKYYPFSYKFSFSAGTTIPIFGATRFVGPPDNILWVE